MKRFVLTPRAFLEMAIAYPGDECVRWPFRRNNKGYPQIGWGGKIVLAHRLVCRRVQGPPPPGKPLAAHSCGNGHLACITPQHLRWASWSQNMDDAISHGRTTRGERAAFVKLTEAQVIEIFRRSKAGETQRSLAVEFRIDQKNVSHIKLGRSWKWLTEGLST